MFIRDDLDKTSHLPAGFTSLDAVRPVVWDGGYFYRPKSAAHRTTLDTDLIKNLVLRAWIGRFNKIGFYTHQKLMAEHGIAGDSVIATTAMGSGKSYGFMIPAFNKVMNDKNARVIAFYPLLALSHDQTDKWYKMASELLMPSDYIQRLDGTIPLGDRLERIRKARILLATPDIIHRWFMGNMQEEDVRAFLSKVQMKIIDEVHEYDGTFGTNSMHLFRRMDHIQTMLTPDYDPAKHRQYIGASGTLPDPVQNFKALTGVNAVHIGAEDNGAPQYRQNIFHARGGAHTVVDIFRTSVDIRNHQSIIFVDSRVSAESLTAQLRSVLADKVDGSLEKAVIPYKAGLRAEDYNRLHDLINDKIARVVVSTPSLESGIDVEFDFGMNVGIPVTKTRLLQRMNRVGRRGESTFGVISGDPKIFGEYSLYDYLTSSELETPTLYPHITSLQLAAGLCLRNEAAKVREFHVGALKPRFITWPKGFNEAYVRTEDPWKNFAPHERSIIPRRRGKEKKSYPQQDLPLRNIPTEQFTLLQKFGNSGFRVLGNIGAENALREYTPGAIIRHLGDRYRVSRWSQTETGETEIYLTSYNGGSSTRLNFVQNINASLSKNRIIKGIFKTPLYENPIDHGFLSYMSMRVNFSVTSFLEFAKNPDGSEAFVRPYRYYDDHELEKVKQFSAENEVDYGPKRHLSYDTFGIAISIPEKWFGADARKSLGEKILKVYCEKNKISPKDLDFEHKNAQINWGPGDKIRTNLLVFYERGGGGIGLLEKLPGQLPQILMVLAEEAKLEIDSDKADQKFSAEFDLDRIENMLRFATNLIQQKPDELKDMIEESTRVNFELPKNFIPVLEPYALARSYTTRTMQQTVKILCPTINPYDQKPGYWVQTINRRRFYNNRWVTVRESQIGVIAGEPAENDNNDGKAPVYRFVAAARITTEIRRPRLAMDSTDGKLYRIVADESDPTHPTLLPYQLPDETLRALRKHNPVMETLRA